MVSGAKSRSTISEPPIVPILQCLTDCRGKVLNIIITEVLKVCALKWSIIVSGFGKTSHNAGEHVFMYKLIKINISINMY